MNPEVGLEGLVSYEQALATVLGAVGAVARLGEESVELASARGRVLAEDVVAPAPLPPLVRSAMDGYAVRSADVVRAGADRPVGLRLVGVAAAGAGELPALEPGTCLRIMTGVPLPVGADAVVPQELAQADGERVLVQRAVAPGAYTFSAGEDAAAGEVVLPVGSWLGAGQLAMLAALGKVRVRVHRAPVVAVAATGDEVVPPEHEPRPGQVRNSNAYGLAGQLEAWGARVRLWGIVPDSADALAEAAAAMYRQADALVFTGGMSVGLRDLVRATLQRRGVRWLVHRVAIRPGRPFAFGVWDGRPVFGLPGTPGGCMVASELFLRPFLAAWLGRRWQPPDALARLAAPVRMTPGRLRLVRARVRFGPRGELEAEPLRRQSSASVRSLADANGLIWLPPELEHLEPGAEVRVRLLADL